MPLFYDPEEKKWQLTLTKEENIKLPLLLKYLEARINTKCVFVDKNHQANVLVDLRVYNDEDFYHS